MRKQRIQRRDVPLAERPFRFAALDVDRDLELRPADYVDNRGVGDVLRPQYIVVERGALELRQQDQVVRAHDVAGRKPARAHPWIDDMIEFVATLAVRIDPAKFVERVDLAID